MKRVLLSISVAFSAFVSFSAIRVPTVSNVAFVQSGRAVTVNYTLSGNSGVVTVDFLTNGVSIGRQHITGLAGDVNKVVAAGEGRSFVWNMRQWRSTLNDDQIRELRTADFQAVVKAWSRQAPPDYLVADITQSGNLAYYETAEQIPGGVTNDVYKTDKMVFRRIHASGHGFWAGSPTTETGRQSDRGDEKTVWGYENRRWISFTNDFYIAVYEVTQRQYDNIFGNYSWNPSPTSAYTGEDAAKHPKDCVKWTVLNNQVNSPADIHSTFYYSGTTGLQLLFMQKTGLQNVRVPSEVEWEFAARAGEETPPSSEELGDYAWYSGNAGGTTHEVGLKQPNKWGLYDMLGNVMEIMQDRSNTSGSNPTYPSVTVDPLGDYVFTGYLNEQDCHIIRGGSFADEASACRYASRYNMRYSYGTVTSDSTNEKIGCRLSIRLW